MVQNFAVFLIICISGGSLGTTTSPQQQNTATLQDLCKVRNDYFTKVVNFWKLRLRTPRTTAPVFCTAHGHHINASFGLDNCSHSVPYNYALYNYHSRKNSDLMLRFLALLGAFKFS